MGEKMIIGFPDWGDRITWSGGSWTAARPATNVADPEMGRVARSTDLQAASLVLDGTFDDELFVEVVAVVFPNATVAATLRVQLFDDLGAELEDTGVIDVFPEVFTALDLLVEAENWSDGKYTQAEIARRRWPRPVRLSQLHLAKSIKLTFDDPSNPDGFLDIAYATCAAGSQLNLNFGYGARYGPGAARTRSQQALGGAKSFQRLPKPRIFTGTIAWLDRRQARSLMYELADQMDLDRVFLLWPEPDPDDAVDWLRTVIMARNRELSPLEYASHDRNAVPLSFEEVL